MTYPFPNINGATVEVWKWISNFIPHIVMDANTFYYMEVITDFGCQLDEPYGFSGD